MKPCPVLVVNACLLLLGQLLLRLAVTANLFIADEELVDPLSQVGEKEVPLEVRTVQALLVDLVGLHVGDGS